MNKIWKTLILGCATKVGRPEKISEQKLDRGHGINTDKAAKATIKAKALRWECVWHLRKRSWRGRGEGAVSKEKLGREQGWKHWVWVLV